MNKNLKTLIYFLLALAPLTIWIVSDGTFLNIIPTNSSGLFFPFIAGKNMLFRLIVEGAFVAWLVLAYREKGYRIQKNLLSLALFAFTGILLIADLFGVNKVGSFFSGFERMEGFVGHIHYVLYFIVLTSMLKTKEEWKKMAKWFFVVSLLVGVIGFLQLLGDQDFFVAKHFPRFSQGCAQGVLDKSDCLLWKNNSAEGGVYWKGMSDYFPIHQSGTRLDSTLGNSAYFAIFCVYFIFLSLFAFTQTTLRNRKILFVGIAFLNVLLLMYSGTRSAVLGLIVGAVTMGAIFLFDWKKFKYEWSVMGAFILLFAYSVFFVKTAIVGVFYLILATVIVATVRSLFTATEKSKKVVAVTFLAGVIILGGFILMRDSKFVTESPVLNRFASISIADPTGNSRLMVWKMSLQGFKEHPLLGWGQDNFPYVFAKYHDPYMYGQEPWFDRSHNVFFDWLIAAGLLGLLAHLSLYFFGALLTHRAKYFSHTEKSIIYGMLIAQFINNLFIFDNLASYILFYAMLAYISSVYALGGSRDKDISFEAQKEWFVPLAILATVILSLASVVFPYFANKATIVGLITYPDKSLLENMQIKRSGFETALSTGLVGRREIREQFVSGVLSVLSLDERKLGAAEASQIVEEKKSWFTLFTSVAKEDLTSYPDDLRVVELYGTFYLHLGDVQDAEKLLIHAHELAPKRQRTSFNLMQLYLTKNDLPKAYSLSKETYELAPPYDVARKAYVSLALRVGEKEFAEALDEIHKDGQKMVYPDSLVSELVGIKDKKVTDLYIGALKKDYPKKTAEIDAQYKSLLSQK